MTMKSKRVNLIYDVKTRTRIIFVDSGIGSRDYVGFDIAIIFYILKVVLVTQMYILIKNHQIIHKICAFTLHKIYLNKKVFGSEEY